MSQEDFFFFDEQTEDGEIAFDDGIETVKWCLYGGSFIEGDHITIERTAENAFLIHGVVCGSAFRDSDGEDFLCSDTDELLDFMKKWGLLRLLTAKHADCVREVKA